MKIYTCKLFNSLILTQDNSTLKVIRENLATIVITKSFFAFERSLERILNRNSIATRVLIQDTYTTKSKRAKIVIRQLMLKRRKHKLTNNLRHKCACRC
jgi:hypothetical protein